MPFLGDREEATAALAALSSIERRPDDEIVVADNSPELVMCAAAKSFHGITAVPANEQQSAYYARNVAAGAARNRWLLFTDADCIPEPDILDRYFVEGIDDAEGAIAGEVIGDPRQQPIMARYQRDRGYLQQGRYVNSKRPYAVTANLLVRASALESVGGFLEGVLCDEDTDFTWRLQDAGWRLGYRPQARVAHRFRESLPSFARMILSYAAGRAWLNRRYAGAYPEPEPLRSILRAVVASIRWWLAGDHDRARFRAIDAIVMTLDRLGGLRDNGVRIEERSHRRADVVVLTDVFPDPSATAIVELLAALTRTGCVPRIEATNRPGRQDLNAARAYTTNYREDQSPLVVLRSLIWLWMRDPLRTLAEVRTQQPPLREIAPIVVRLKVGGERHLHAVGSGDGAAIAPRVARLAGCRFSVEGRHGTGPEQAAALIVALSGGDRGGSSRAGQGSARGYEARPRRR